MNVFEFNDEEWRDILAEFRRLVVSAGYAEWDAAAADSLNEKQERPDGQRFDRQPARPAVQDLRNYVRAFVDYLKVRSTPSLRARSQELSRLLHTETGTPVESFYLNIEGSERPISSGDDDPDSMIDILRVFLMELNGESGGFWDDGGDSPLSDT